MTPEDVAKLETVGAVAVSPDGTSVAYTVGGRPDVSAGEKDGGYRSTLYVTNGPNGGRAYLPEGATPGSVTFSPDGSMVTYAWSAEDDDRSVWGIPVDGGAPRKLAGVEDTAVRTYAWAPDGQRVYMLVGGQKDEQRAKERKAGFNAIVYEEENTFNRVFVANVGADMDAEPTEIGVPGYVTAMEVSPDGRFATIASAPTPQIDDDYTSKRISVLDLSTGAVVRTIETPGKLGDNEISPDGTTMSLIAAVDENDPAATVLHMVDIGTGNITAVNADAAEAATDTEWLADGRLAVIVDVGAESELRLYDKGGNLLQTVEPGAIQLSSLQSGGNRLMVTADSPMHPTELFMWDGQNGFMRWTDSNPWLAEIDFGTQRTMTYTARDGQEVEGILIEPVDGVPAGGAPTIMMVHGGPEAHYKNGWLTAYSMPGQVGAGEGYAVFHPNYRGSTGYGVSFAKQHQGDYAGKEFNDIVDAKRALVAEGITDGDRTGITGGSYGGYASAWGATALSEEYVAAVMFVGISNQISKFGTTDIPNEMFLVHSRKWPWEDWQGMLEVSPIYHVDKAETPILIMHGAEDTRVAPSQSYELYRTIKVRKPDTPVRLVLYPGEGHGNQRAGSRYDYNLRMMRWFDTYLKTGNRSAPLPGPRPDVGMGDSED
ncbi:S9 family peptidase [Paraurantiacibacter namhicola]|nr:S9 family peptidase [Paraurantiacibacter namhicola]